MILGRAFVCPPMNFGLPHSNVRQVVKDRWGVTLTDIKVGHQDS